MALVAPPPAPPPPPPRLVSDTSMNFTENQHGPLLLQQLRRQRHLAAYCDIRLSVDGRVYCAHRCVLAAASDFFAQLLADHRTRRPHDQITISCGENSGGADGGGGDVFGLVLEYIYSGCVVVDQHCVHELVRLANHLGVPKLIGHCAEYLARSLGADTCLRVLYTAEQYRLPELRRAALAYAQRHTNAVLCSRHALQLSAGEVEQLLTNRELQLLPERQLMFVLDWVHEGGGRDHELRRLLLAVPLQLIDVDILERLMRSHQLFQTPGGGGGSGGDRCVLLVLQSLADCGVRLSGHDDAYRQLEERFLQENELVDSDTFLSMAITTAIEELEGTEAAIFDGLHRLQQQAAHTAETAAATDLSLTSQCVIAGAEAAAAASDAIAGAGGAGAEDTLAPLSLVARADQLVYDRGAEFCTAAAATGGATGDYAVCCHAADGACYDQCAGCVLPSECAGDSVFGHGGAAGSGGALSSASGCHQRQHDSLDMQCYVLDESAAAAASTAGVAGAGRVISSTQQAAADNELVVDGSGGGGGMVFAFRGLRDAGLVDATGSATSAAATVEAATAAPTTAGTGTLLLGDGGGGEGGGEFAADACRYSGVKHAGYLSVADSGGDDRATAAAPPLDIDEQYRLGAAYNTNNSNHNDITDQMYYTERTCWSAAAAAAAATSNHTSYQPCQQLQQQSALVFQQPLAAASAAGTSCCYADSAETTAPTHRAHTHPNCAQCDRARDCVAGCCADGTGSCHLSAVQQPVYQHTDINNSGTVSQSQQLHQLQLVMDMKRTVDTASCQNVTTHLNHHQQQQQQQQHQHHNNTHNQYDGHPPLLMADTAGDQHQQDAVTAETYMVAQSHTLAIEAPPGGGVDTGGGSGGEGESLLVSTVGDVKCEQYYRLHPQSLTPASDETQPPPPPQHSEQGHYVSEQSRRQEQDDDDSDVRQQYHSDLSEQQQQLSDPVPISHAAPTTMPAKKRKLEPLLAQLLEEPGCDEHVAPAAVPVRATLTPGASYKFKKYLSNMSLSDECRQKVALTVAEVNDPVVDLDAASAIEGSQLADRSTDVCTGATGQAAPTAALPATGRRSSAPRGTAKQTAPRQPRARPIYTCDVCATVVNTKRLYLLHMRTHFDGPPFVCGACGARTSSLVQLVRHRRQHEQHRPHQCAECGSSFWKRYDLLNHMHVHSGERPHACDECGARFALLSTLRQHAARHRQQRPLSCDHCPFTTKYVSHLSLHRKLHAGDLYRCSHADCAYTTPKRSHLREHLQSHAARRTYQCSECARAFNVKTHLSRHMRTHRAEASHRCCQCDYSTYRSDRLRAHMKTHERQNHKKSPQQQQQSPAPPSPPVTQCVATHISS